VSAVGQSRLQVTFDVTDLTENEIGALIAEVVCQGEPSEWHGNAPVLDVTTSVKAAL